MRLLNMTKTTVCHRLTFHSVLNTMAHSEEFETTDVVICGCGPTGAMLSAYLGQMSIRNVVLEKHDEITTDPRGIALDEDGIRLLQGVGIYQSIYSEIGSCMGRFQFVGGTDSNLDKKPFAEINLEITQGTGHVGFLCHKQPVMEKHLRKAMASSEFCELRSGCAVDDLSEDGDWTYCCYSDAQGNKKQIRSRFFIGADGKTGFTRKHYLESRGIKMEQAHHAFYDETWVALNWEISLPSEKTHPDFPLWSLGYTPEQIYDLFFPVSFRFLCNPTRPAVCGRFGLPSDRLWRFEFVVLKDEDGEEMSQPEMIKKVVFPYITHPGTRYGSTQDITYPEDCIKVLRSRPFRFAARSCNRWSHGRVVLCGDAAHVFPPFGGQGIASGFRDAITLAWRLALLCRPQPFGPSYHEKVLSAWYLERKQQLERSLATTVQNGQFVTESDPIKIFLRDCYFFLVRLIPWLCRSQFDGRNEMIRYKYSAGMPFIPEYNGGLCLPQVYCKAVDQPAGDVLFTDDVIFGPHKKGLFQLFIYLKSLSELPQAREEISNIEDISKGELHLAEVTFIVEDMQCNPSEAAGQDLSSVFRLASGEEFSNSPLCHRRPKALRYDPYYLGNELRGSKFVIARPDRFTFAACDNKEDLRSAVLGAVAYLQGGDIKYY